MKVYLCVNDVVLDLVLGNWVVFQNDMQPHRHHTGQPVDQTGINFCRHPPLHKHAVHSTQLLTCITGVMHNAVVMNDVH